MKIKDLGNKIEWLAILFGYAFSNEKFSDHNIWNAMGINDKYQWSRKKTGQISTDNQELSRLFIYFELTRYVLDATVFTLPMDQFRDALRTARVWDPWPDGRSLHPAGVADRSEYPTPGHHVRAAQEGRDPGAAASASHPKPNPPLRIARSASGNTRGCTSRFPEKVICCCSTTSCRGARSPV